MTGRVKFGVATVLMVLAIVTAPALLCSTFLASTSKTHRCCPPKTAPGRTVVATCCIHAPAVTSMSVDIPVPAVASAAFDAAEATMTTTCGQSPADSELDTSPPHCSSILRI
jgi:hypothetical protein